MIHYLSQKYERSKVNDGLVFWI